MCTYKSNVVRNFMSFNLFMWRPISKIEVTQFTSYNISYTSTGESPKISLAVTTKKEIDKN